MSKLTNKAPYGMSYLFLQHYILLDKRNMITFALKKTTRKWRRTKSFTYAAIADRSP